MSSNQLPTDVEELQRLLLESQQQAALAQTQVEELTATVTKQSKELEKKDRQIKELIQAMRGKQRESVDPDQLSLFELEELEQLLEEKRQDEIQAKRRRKKHGRRVIPDGLPEEEVIIELPEDKRVCPHDNSVMQFIRYETSKQLDYIPAQLKVIVTKRAVYACQTKHDEAKLVTAPMPPQPVPKGLAAPGLLAAVTLAKFGDHLPGYRQEDIFSRYGADIRRSTIFDWMAAVADLVQPLVALMKQRVLKSTVIHTDDTKVKMIDPENSGTITARFWAYIGDRGHPYTIYDFTKTRERTGPQEFLRGFQGYLQADAYSGYDGIYLDSAGGIKEVACWTHCRRYWWKLRELDPERAHYVIAVIKRLYDIERLTASGSLEATLALRQEYSAPLLKELKQWLDQQDVLPKSKTAEAMTYTRNQWEALNRYLDDGALSIDNNAAERAMKSVAIGRKNWLFVGSENAGKRAANLMSLIGSCKENRVEPWAYLRDVLTRLPAGAELATLLPDVWLRQHPQHRWNIADQRAEERQSKGDL